MKNSIDYKIVLVCLVDHDCEESLHLEGILEFFAEINQTLLWRNLIRD